MEAPKIGFGLELEKWTPATEAQSEASTKSDAMPALNDFTDSTEYGG